MLSDPACPVTTEPGRCDHMSTSITSGMRAQMILGKLGSYFFERISIEYQI
jgi:hypothetical protein